MCAGADLQQVPLYEQHAQLQGYSNMPALHAGVEQPHSMPPCALAVHGSKGMPRQITPKSIFEWQPQSGTASPTTPNIGLLQQQLDDPGNVTSAACLPMAPAVTSYLLPSNALIQSSQKISC